ncbi:MAG: NADP-dependent oxidoreductase [Halioglobus sp.]
MQNRKMILLQRPAGNTCSELWQLDSESVPELTPGQVLTKVEFISMDPTMRAWMNEGSYDGGVALGGEAMWAFGVGRVVQSQHPNFTAGDAVHGMLKVQDYAVCAGDDLDKLSLGEEPLSYHAGFFGMTGMTSYFGITAAVDVQPGQQVLVSTAAGAVGSLVAQIAKLKGAHVVGIAGGAKKCKFVVETLGCDACIDYKSGDFSTQLKEMMPNGIDIYYDNVGVPILDFALSHINECATVVLCGVIAQIHNLNQVVGPSQYLKIAERNANLKGFTSYHYRDRFPEAVVQLRQWLEAGEIRNYEQLEHGLENFPAVFEQLFHGGNVGKLLLAP